MKKQDNDITQEPIPPSSSSPFSLSEDLKKEIASRSSSSQDYFVGVDVGATNVRVALSFLSNGKTSDPLFVLKFQSSTKTQLVSGLVEAGKQISTSFGKNSAGACLAAAGPVTDGGKRVVVTNYLENDSVLLITDMPTSLFPPENAFFINDLESCSYGILALNEQQSIHHFFRVLWPSQPAEVSPIILKSVPYLILAMGTGLGVSLLIKPRSGTRHEVIPLEFGHSQLPSLGVQHPDYQDEKRMKEFIATKLKRNEHDLEVEDICSGRGLGFAYEWIASENPAAPQNLSTEAIVQRLREGCEYARRAMKIHYTWLFRCCQTLAVGFQVGGIFLAGDNQVNNEPFVLENLDHFKKEYLHHPKTKWIQEVPVMAQKVSHNINILGTLYFAHHFGSLSR